MKKILAVCALAFAGLFCFEADTARAEKGCGEPQMTDERIESAVLIFQGTLAGVGPAKLPPNVQITMDGGQLSDLRAFTFDVTRGWKMPDDAKDDPKKVTVIQNTFKKETYEKDVEYLVVSGQRAKGVFLAPVCGSAVPVAAAAEQIEDLEAYFRKLEKAADELREGPEPETQADDAPE